MSKRTDAEILRDLRGVEGELSPENLFCDGEISHAQGRKKERALLARRAKLLKELGREPTGRELYGC